MARRLISAFAVLASLAAACPSDPALPACLKMPAVTVSAGVHPVIDWAPTCVVYSVEIGPVDTALNVGWVRTEGHLDLRPPVTINGDGNGSDSVVIGRTYYVELNNGQVILGRQTFTAH